jgi:hypothetical protein
VVGDGGLVEHTSEPDAAGYPDHWSESWVAAMWPIEPLHYVGRAAPAALLFQNGTQDNMVPPCDALRYQQAGSQPKTVIWYDAGHGLPRESFQDQSEWLYQTLGPGCFNFSKLNLSAASAPLDRLKIAYLILVGIPMLFLFIDMALGVPWTFGSLLSWGLVVIFFGPLGFLVYWITWRRPSRSADSTAALSISKSALGSTVWAVAGNLLGGIIVIEFALTFPEIYNQGIYLQIIFSLLIPFITGILFYNLVRLVSKLGRRYRLKLRRPLFAEIVSTCLVMGGVYPVVIVLINGWLARLYPFGWQLANPALLIIFTLGGIAGAVLAFPAHYWFNRSGFIVWGAPVSLEEVDRIQIVEKPRFRWYQIAGVLLIVITVMLVGITIANMLTS